MLYPLTHPQKRIWYIEKLYPGTSLYNLGGPSRIKGEVDFKLFEEVLNIFVNKNEGLRLRLTEQDGEARQYVSEFERLKVDFFDFSKHDDPEKAFEKWAGAEMSKPFTLLDSVLYYFALFKIDDNNNGLLVKFHHIICDGWSIQVASENIYGTYLKLLNGEQIGEEAECSYLEYLGNEQKYLASDRFLKNRNYWYGKYKDLPEDFLSRSSENLSGSRITFQLEEDFSGKIKDFAVRNKCSVNTFFIALFLIYIYKTTNNEDIIIGTPVLNRSGKKEKSIFGMFTSTMPFRFRIEGCKEVSRLLELLNKELMDCFFNQKYPYDLLVHDIELKKQGYDSLFETCVNYYNTSLHNEINGTSVENVELHNGNQLYSLQLIIKEWSASGNLTLMFDYKVNDYIEKQIYDIFSCLKSLSTQMLDKPDSVIDVLDVLPEDEKVRQIYGFNSVQASCPVDKTIHQLFEEQVDKTPDKAAICFENLKLTVGEQLTYGKQLTYSTLNKKSNQLARLLTNKGVVRGSIVGLMVTHSLEAVIGILGILKAGGAYVPIDPGYPSDRIEYMLEDSGSKILLTNCTNVMPETSFGGEVINLNDEELYTGDDANPAPTNEPQDLAYVIYTSGSTGKPKGVMIEHRGLVNYIWWAKKMYVKSEDDTFALYSSLSFDLTVTSIFTPLIGGNKIIVYRDDGQEYVLYRIMKDNRVTVIKLTPSHLSLLKDMDNRNSSVRRFIVGGEDLTVSLASSIHRSFGRNIEIYNEYGPTETVVGCMIHEFDSENDIGASVPIGIPADNVQIYVLDKWLKPLPVGSIGEMYISGDGVARGYLNRPELTGERFIPNPYALPQRMYKTGDLARFLHSGKIEYAGRADQQVKIHGYRIELGEIEKQLMNHELIGNAVVIDRQNANGDKYLCAYITTVSEVAVSEIRNHLLKTLPEYMVPMYFVEIEEIPLTPNGKVDRSSLPEPKMEVEGQEKYAPPVSELEKKLVDVVGKILGIHGIGMKSNFYHHGGDSIKAIQIASKLNEMGMKIRARDILARPVLEEMVLCLEYDCNNIDQSPCTGTFKPTPIYSWFFSQNFRDFNYYNQSVVLKLVQDIAVDDFGKILDELVRHHDALRLNVNLETCELYYNNNHLNETNIVQYFDLSSMHNEEQDIKMRQLDEEFKSGFDIEKSILIKASMYDLGSRGRRVLITAHHMVIDGVSWRILLEDIYNMCEQIKGGKSISLPLKTHSLKAWACELEGYAASQAEKEKAFWERMSGKNFTFPTDFDKGEDLLENSSVLSFELTEGETEQLLYKAGSTYGTEPYELMITALVMTISDFAMGSEALIELEGHGREEIAGIAGKAGDTDITRTVGWFTSMYPVLFEKTGQELSENIKLVKEQIRKLPGKGLGFGLLKYYSRFALSNSQKPIRFNYLGDFGSMYENEYFKCTYEASGNECSNLNHMTSLLDINAMIMEKVLKLSVTYSKNKFYEETIKAIAARFKGHLKAIIDFCCGKSSKEFTPSDFDMVKVSEDDIESLFT